MNKLYVIYRSPFKPVTSEAVLITADLTSKGLFDVLLEKTKALFNTEFSTVSPFTSHGFEEQPLSNFVSGVNLSQNDFAIEIVVKSDFNDAITPFVIHDVLVKLVQVFNTFGGAVHNVELEHSFTGVTYTPSGEHDPIHLNYMYGETGILVEELIGLGTTISYEINTKQGVLRYTTTVNQYEVVDDAPIAVEMPVPLTFLVTRINCLEDHFLFDDAESKVKVESTGNTGVSLTSANTMAEVITKAIDNNRSIVDYREAEVEVTENLSFRHLNVILPNVKFKMMQRSDGSFPYIELGGNSSTTDNPYQELGTVLRSTFDHRDLDPTLLKDHPSIIVVGAKNQTIKVKQADYIRLELRGDTQSESIAYSNFDFNFVQRLEIAPSAGNEADNSLWCNENLFNIRRMYGLDIYGAYHHNNNLFVGASIDYKNSYINLQQGRLNRFIGFRLEEVHNITFAPNTEFNVLEATWYSSIPKMFDLGAKPYTVNDQGKFNRIVRMVDQFSQKYRFGYKTGTIQAQGTWSVAYSSKRFEVAKNDVVVMDWDNKEAQYLITVECFDKNGVVVIPTDFTSPFLKVNSSKKRLEGNYPGGQKYGTRYLHLNDSNVETIKVSINSTNDLTKQLSTKFTVDLYATGVRGVIDEPMPNA